MAARFLGFSAAFALFVASGFAQVTGRLSGSVTDSSGAAIPNATVNLLLAGGAKPILTTVTTGEGLFSFTNVRPEKYDLAIESSGFLKYSLRGVTIDPARETSLPAIKLELSAVTQSVDVTADAQTVQTSNAEISTTVTNAQIRRLPMLDRDPMALITTQAGVSSNNDDIVINGTRSSYSNVTLDGINIQDNFIRTGGLGFQPNLLLLDQVSEFTISTSNTNSTVGGGASQITISTPSGTNVLHGKAYWYNRNNALAAGAWFDNKDGIPKAFLNQNQLGGALGGRIVKDKLFFYTNYEAFRNRQKQQADNAILTDTAAQGFFRYIDNTGSIRQVNILTAMGVKIDPVIQNLISQIPPPSKINNFNVGDSPGPGKLLNTAGYAFQQADNRTRDNVTARLDYNLSTKHTLFTSFVWNRDVLDRPDAENDFSVVPKVTNRDHATFSASSWRWNPSPHLTNEVRGGFNLAPVSFPTTQQIPSYFVSGTVFANPVNAFLPQSRTTNTYLLADNATYVHGRHTIQFGFQTQQVRIMSSDYANTVPTYGLAVGNGQVGLTARQLPGVSANDLANADQLLATLGGLVDTFGQTFNITSRSSGFVAGAPFLRHYSYNNYAGYIHDTWKISSRLTATLGLRYEYYTVLTERDSLELTPVIQGSYINTLLSDATLNFAGNSVGRPLYQPDRKDFAPNVGLAWDITGSGKTVLRAGYSIHYVNDEIVASILNNVELTNQGLVGNSVDFGRSETISAKPAIPVPTFQVPLKQDVNYANDPTSALGIPNPNLTTPYVQEYSFGIQHEWKKAIFEARYVGNHGVKEFRAFDYNQVIINQNGFLNAFNLARQNGFLALNAVGTFDPRYNPAIKGSQPIPLFNSISIPGPGGIAQGGLTNSFIRGLIQTGEPAELAYQYAVNGFTAPISFFPNPNALGADTISNFSNSTYNSLQVDVRRQVSQGLTFQGNYTFSKVLSDAAGDTQERYEAFLDLNNTKIERSVAPFDIRHAIKANWQYDLPIGKGQRFNVRRLGGLVGGWSLTGILTWQSGSPFSIVSQRGTLNRESRSGFNTADTSLTGPQLADIVKFQMTGNGPYVVAPSAIGQDGRGVAADGDPNFNGQVFTNPGPGTIGTLQRRMFYGPWTFDLDAGIQKLTHITERHSVELRMEVANVLNHPNFTVFDQNINSPTFGQVFSNFSTTNGLRRVIQFGLRYEF
jgi:hypothetical protein